MKKMKKIFALLLTFVMVMGMATSVFAKDANLTGHTYAAYQIFSGTQGNDASLGNVAWGSGIKSADFLAALQASEDFGEPNPFAACTTAQDVAEAIKGWADKATNAKKFAQIAYKNKKGDGTPVEAGNTTLDAGYYLVVDTTVQQPTDENFATNVSLLQLTKKGTFDIENKVSIPEVEKKIVEGTNKVDANSTSIGKVVNYEIKGTIPSNISEYETYFYKFTDTLSKGLTYNNDMKVTVDGKDLTEYFYKNATTYSATDGTTITVSIKDLLALNNIFGDKKVTITKDSNVVLTYSATLNENAVIAGAGNPNNVDLEYSNNPDESGTPDKNPPGTTPPEPEEEHPTGVTPKDEVKTYVTELTITKTDGNNILTGAGFTLTGNGVKVMLVTEERFTVDADGAYWKLANGKYTTTAPILEDVKNEDGEVVTKNNVADYDADTTTKYKKEVVKVAKGDGKTDTNVTAMVGEDGTVTFTGLGAGDYTITETTTPDGYNTISPIDFTVTFTASTATFATTNNKVTVGTTTNKLAATIVNKKGLTLPETGGMGTTLFYIFGTALVLGAGVLLITKRRMEVK